jgi:hypothetical protein
MELILRPDLHSHFRLRNRYDCLIPNRVAVPLQNRKLENNFSTSAHDSALWLFIVFFEKRHSALFLNHV